MEALFNGFFLLALLIGLGGAGVFVMLVRKHGLKDTWGRVVAFGMGAAGLVAALFASAGPTPPGV